MEAEPHRTFDDMSDGFKLGFGQLPKDLRRLLDETA